MFPRRVLAFCIVGVIGLAGLVGGCAERSHCRAERRFSCAQRPHRGMQAHRPRSTLLFGRERSAPLATRIGRAPWPAVQDGYESTEDTVYVEYYRDYFGNGYNENSNPQRQFYSYRVGATSR